MRLIAYKRFSKRINSTKRPSFEDDENDVLWVFMKKNTSLLNPVFELTIDKTLSTEASPFTYTYCQFHNRYYYVTEIVLQNDNIYELHCRHDPLATYRWYIENTTAYIEYAADDRFYNKWIPDKRMTMRTDISKASNTAPIFAATNGTFILAVAGASANARVGMINYWAVSNAAMTTLADWLMNEDILDWDYWKKLLNSPYDALIECHWVPWHTDTAGGSPILIGNKASDATGYGLSGVYYSTPNSFNITVPSVYGDWRDFEPYSQTFVHLPFCGTFPIDRAKLGGSNTLKVTYALDPLSGEVSYNLQCGAWQMDANAFTAVNIPIGQTTDNKVGGIGKAIAGIGAAVGGAVSIAATGGASLPAVGAIVGGVAGVADGAMTYFSSDNMGRGACGGFASGHIVSRGGFVFSPQGNVTVTQVAHKFATYTTSMRYTAGLPCFSMHKIGDLNHGFIKCAGASVEMEGFDSDRSAVNIALNNGIFIE